MKDKLMIATKCKKTIEYIFKTVDNYPHKYNNLKDNIINVSFNILETVYNGNIDSNCKKLIILKIQMLDYYLKLSYKYNILSKRRYEVTSNYLLELLKMIYGWLNEESRQSL